MTKTLTEQWRDGTLPEGWYYTIIKGFTDKEQMMIDYYIPELHHFEIKPTECIKEVLAPVPSYNEFLVLSDFKKIEKDAIDNLVKIHTEKLEKKLAIAIKALKEINENYRFTVAQDVVYKALKEMEGVKK